MVFKDYYKILSVEYYATTDEIRRAYYAKSKRWHPDANEGYDTTKIMQDINEAYAILKDKNLRKQYDEIYLKTLNIEPTHKVYNGDSTTQSSTIIDETDIYESREVYETTKLTDVDSFFKAHRLMEMLNDENIACAMNDHSSNTVLGITNGAIPVISIIVDETDYEKAQSVLQKFEKECYDGASQSNVDDDCTWCPECGSENIIKMKIPIEHKSRCFFQFILSHLKNESNVIYHCKDCGYEFSNY